MGNREAAELVEDAIVHLWSVVNDLNRLKDQCPRYYRVSIFGSARLQPDDPTYIQVRDLAAQLAAMGCDIVTGGGPGLMQAANEGEHIGDPDGKTRSYGIRVELPFEKGANPFVEKNFTHGTFYSRLHHFIRLSSAFIVVPGGIGTTLETFMVWQLLQVEHITDRPLILVGSMWRELLGWANTHLAGHNPPLASDEDIHLAQCVDTIDEAIAIIQQHKAKFTQGSPSVQGSATS